MEEYNLEAYEPIEYQFQQAYNRKDSRYAWLFSSRNTNLTMKNRNIYLDSTGKEFIQIDTLVVDLGDVYYLFIFIPTNIF